MKEVRAEAPCAHLGLEIAVGGGQDAHVEAAHTRLADPLHLVLLERPSRRGCTSSGSSPTSSMNRVLPSATSKRPGRDASAPVNAPLAWPYSSASTSEGAMAEASKRISGRSRRADAA